MLHSAGSNSTGFRAFGKAMFAHWGTAMSGPLSVPAAVAAVFVTNNTAQILLGLTAFVCVWAAAYGIWKAEREKNQSSDPSRLIKFVKARQTFSIAEAACLLAGTDLVQDDLRGPAAGYLHEIKQKIVNDEIAPTNAQKMELFFIQGSPLAPPTNGQKIRNSLEITKDDLHKLAAERDITIQGLNDDAENKN